MNGTQHRSASGTNPALGLLRTLGLLVAGKVRFHGEHVGCELEADDHERYRVFRRVVIRSEAPAPRALFIVRFTPAHMTVRQNIRFSRLPLLIFMGFRGFRSKYWCVDDATGACEGVYEWQTVADAEAYAASIALRFMTNRSVPGSVSHRILERSDDSPWPISLRTTTTSRSAGAAEMPAVGFTLSEGMEVPDELSSLRFARQRSKLAGTIRGSFLVIKGEYA